MFDYNINKTASNLEFKNACAKIERHFPNCKKDALLIDVDGSLIQVYRNDDNKITVFNDYEVDAVFIESEIDMNEIFKLNDRAEMVHRSTKRAEPEKRF